MCQANCIEAGIGSIGIRESVKRLSFGTSGKAALSSDAAELKYSMILPMSSYSVSHVTPDFHYDEIVLTSNPAQNLSRASNSSL
jgi:hypothetical protein